MIILDVEGAAAFLGLCYKNARSLIIRLPHGNASRTNGPNAKLLIAQETLEKFVLGEIEPAPIGERGAVVNIAKARQKKHKYVPPKGGPIPKRPYTR